MPLTETGIYYADTSTNMSIADITAAMATSVGKALTVLQVVSTTNASQTVNNTSTKIDTGLSAAITPKFASSKILVLASQGGCYKSASNAGNWLLLYLNRGTTELAQTFGSYTGSALNLNVGTMTINYLDSPNTTSSVTYKTTFANDFNGAGVQVNHGGGASYMTLIEVAG